jgi:endonuclease G
MISHLRCHNGYQPFKKAKKSLTRISHVAWSRAIITPRSLIILLLLLAFGFCGSPRPGSHEKTQYSDTVTIRYKYYTTTFSKSKHIPTVVKYWLTKAMLSCQNRVKRTNRFRPDPLLPEYTNLDKDYNKSGYDRGHNLAAADCGCDSIGMIESFYYSNACPQTPSLNRGRWKALEGYTRRLVLVYDSVLVWCGAVTTSGRHIGKVAVPDYCWKIIYIKRSGAVEAYSFKNDNSHFEALDTHKVSLDSVQNLSGFFFTKF